MEIVKYIKYFITFVKFEIDFLKKNYQNITEWFSKENSFIKRHVIPEQNNDKEYYVYSINSFI